MYTSLLCVLCFKYIVLFCILWASGHDINISYLMHINEMGSFKIIATFVMRTSVFRV